MPIGNAPVRTSSDDPALVEAPQRWAIPLGTMAGTPWLISYNVFVAGGLLFGVVGVLASQGRQPELGWVASAGVLFWISGWAIQLLALLTTSKLLDSSTPVVRIGLLGVEYPPRRWWPWQALVVLVTSIGSLLVLASFYRWVDGGFQMPMLAPVADSQWHVPSLGFSAHDSLWKSGAWLLGVQAVLQMFPLPGTAGRQMIAAWSALCGARQSLPSQVVLFRRCLDALAALTVVLALAMVTSGDPGWMAKWPLVMVAGLLLWVSSRRGDVPLMIEGFQASNQVGHEEASSVGAHLEAGGGGSRPRLLKRARAGIQQWRRRRRVRRAIHRERAEASDAARLDEILNRLHEQGPESLSAGDRRILQRVSDNLRRQRDGEMPHE